MRSRGAILTLLMFLKIALGGSLAVFIYSRVSPFSEYFYMLYNRIIVPSDGGANSLPLYYAETNDPLLALMTNPAVGAVSAAIAASMFALHLLLTLKNAEWLKSRRLHRIDYYLSAVVVLLVLVLASTPFVYFRYSPWAHIFFVFGNLALWLLLWETTLVRLRARTFGETSYFVRAIRCLPKNKLSSPFFKVGLLAFVAFVSAIFVYRSFSYIYDMSHSIYLLDRDIDAWMTDRFMTSEIIMPVMGVGFVFLWCYFYEAYGELVGRLVGDKEAADRFRVDLIANVTHDIRTPLTSVINYVDLIDKLDIDNAELREYAAALKRASARMKLLVNDLLDASKAGTGNLPVEISDIDIAELLGQIAGDFDAAFAEKGLAYVSAAAEGSPPPKQSGEAAAEPAESALAGAPEPPAAPVKTAAAPVLVKADGAHLWRVLENVFSNVVNHAMPNTRVYVSIETKRAERPLRKTMKKIYGSDTNVILRVKNVSREPLNITPDELMEQFVRGDASRRSEGSGLGLSIAKDLVWLMDGGFEITIDGDLFTATITLPSSQV
jgi:signal transduction histidine kinase